MNSKFKIKGLDCVNCANELEKAIQKNSLGKKLECEIPEEIYEEIRMIISK